VERAWLDWEAVVRRQHEVVTSLQPAPASLEKKGSRVILGQARFVDAHTLEVKGSRLGGERIVIAAGSEPVRPDVPGRELCITSDELLFLPRFPETLILVGAGAIGLELAGAFADLGARVTVIGRDAEVLAGFDPDVAAYLRRFMEARGVTFHLGARVTRVSGGPGAVTVHADSDRGALEVTGAQVGLTVGRRFNPRVLGADAPGLETGALGLKVGPDLRTSVPHIYAAGDAAGNRQLTTVAAYEGRLAGTNALRGEREAADHSVVPQVIFTTPEIAAAGLTDAESRARGIPCAVSRQDMRGASNGRATGEDGGYLKLVFDNTSRRLLGVQMVSYAAAELIQFCALAIRSGVTADRVAAQLSVHPSHGERLIKSFGPDLLEVCEVE
jgi:pyruvate/2-oxoglutarate dehydrogenase complex dihydrolipoamide dehydrogenase (E3) component